MKLIAKIRLWLARHALRIELKDKNSAIRRELAASVSVLANERFLQMLDNERIAHCAKCAVRGPLRVLNGQRFCNNHFMEVAKLSGVPAEIQPQVVPA